MLGRLATFGRKQLARIPRPKRRSCFICRRRVGRFLPYRDGWRGAPPVMRALRITGSDLDNYLCPSCGCNDRDRHLWAYLEASGLLSKVVGSRILHFAPEPRLVPLLQHHAPARYVQADLFPSAPGIDRVDMLAMPFADETFDFVIANHVLEHVTDDARALREIHRVLVPDGTAILQTPFSAILERTIEDCGVRDAQARLQLYGQEDHVRLYGRDFESRVVASGFQSAVRTHEQLLPELDAERFGMNAAEPFLLFRRV